MFVLQSINKSLTPDKWEFSPVAEAPSARLLKRFFFCEASYSVCFLIHWTSSPEKNATYFSYPCLLFQNIGKDILCLWHCFWNSKKKPKGIFVPNDLFFSELHYDFNSYSVGTWKLAMNTREDILANLDAVSDSSNCLAGMFTTFKVWAN